jgi:hypothetical protein
MQKAFRLLQASGNAFDIHQLEIFWTYWDAQRSCFDAQHSMMLKIFSGNTNVI